MALLSFDKCLNRHFGTVRQTGIERTRRDGGLLAAEFGEPGRAAPHHVLEDLIDLKDVISKGALEQCLGTQIIPKTVPRCLLPHRLTPSFSRNPLINSSRLWAEATPMPA